MARLITAATFIHSNMPKGATHDAPFLTGDDAWDVAAFLESKKRPPKAALSKDFPIASEKPVDVPYGPYSDGFPPEQHKYGPFKPIREKLRLLKQQSINTDKVTEH